MLTATTPTEAALDIEALKKAFEDFDLATLLPKLDSIFDKITLICRICVLVGPIILLILGLFYLFLSPKEANYYFGYRCYYGMGSVHAWRFTQRIAGMVLGGVISLALCIVCNIVVTPLYTAVSTEAVIGMIVPILVPFNLMKIVLNCVLCALVMKPMAKVLVQD